MHNDRRIFITTGVLAVVFAAAINALAPRDPFAGITVHREPAAVSHTAQASPAPPVVAERDAQARVGASM